MKSELKGDTMLYVLQIIAWIIFVGVMFEAGGFICNFILMLAYPEYADRFWMLADTRALYQYDRVYFIIISIFICVVGILRSIIFYQIIKVLSQKKLDMYKPFNKDIQRFIFSLALLSLFVGVLSHLGGSLVEWLTVKKEVSIPSLQKLRIAGADVWIFMGIVLMVIAQIFKRGIAIQSENDLTV